MGNKRVTVRQLFDAMEKNYLPKATGQLIIRNGAGDIVSACAFGQAALHLNVNPEQLLAGARQFAKDYNVAALNEAVHLNDSSDSTISAIARFCRGQVPGRYLDVPIGYFDERVTAVG